MTDMLEKAAAETVKTAADVVSAGSNLVETVIKKAWTLTETALKKDSPAEYLSPKAVRAIQGKPE